MDPRQLQILIECGKYIFIASTQRKHEIERAREKMYGFSIFLSNINSQDYGKTIYYKCTWNISQGLQFKPNETQTLVKSGSK